jgi:polysaccharide biosynthesis/export protein
MRTFTLSPILGLAMLFAGLPLARAELMPAAAANQKSPMLASVAAASAAGSKETAAATAAVYFTPELDDRQKLAVGDRVTFRVLEDKEDPKSLLVTDAGDVDVPYLGLSPVVGKTCREVAADWKTRLESRYYYHAHVVVALESANRAGAGRRVYVTGQVRTPGPIDIPAGETITVGQAVMRAGGFAEYADKRHVRVVRDRGAGGEKNTMTVNVLDVWQKGRTADDLVLEPNDLIFIPTRLVNF